MDMLRRDLSGLLDALGIDRTHMKGLSLGGMTALEFAIAEPERVGQMAICDARGDVPAAFREDGTAASNWRAQGAWRPS